MSGHVWGAAELFELVDGEGDLVVIAGRLKSFFCGAGGFFFFAGGELGGGFLEEPGHSGAAQVGGWILQEIHDHGVGARGVCGTDQVPSEHASIRGVVCFLQKRRQGIQRNGEPVALGAVGNRAGCCAQSVLSQWVSTVKRLQQRR